MANRTLLISYIKYVRKPGIPIDTGTHILSKCTDMHR